MLKRPVVLVIAVMMTAACGSKSGNKNNGGGTAPAANNGPTFQPRGANGAPPVVAPAAENYQGQQLNPNVALAGMGRWETIGEQEFFIPDTSLLDDPNDWQPYQDGRWTYDNQRGWTWVSAEPWGWMTDHYGIWRHHQTRWIWMKFDDMHYEPHCVTWFDEGDHIGWYPYFEGYSRGYTMNDRYGFNDGYWQGRQSVLSVGISGGGFFLGFTLVNRSDATVGNIRRHIIRDRGIILNAAHRSHQGDRINRVGRFPGGDRNRSHDFVQRFSQVRAPVGDAQWVTSRGGARFLQPFNGRDDRRDNDRRDNDRRDDNRRDNDRRNNNRPGRDTGRLSPAVVPPAQNNNTNNIGQRRNQPDVVPARPEGGNQGRGGPEVVPARPAPAAPAAPAAPSAPAAPAVAPAQPAQAAPSADQQRGRPSIVPPKAEDRRKDDNLGRPDSSPRQDRTERDGEREGRRRENREGAH